MSPANFDEIRVWRPGQARLPRHVVEPNRDSYTWRPQIQIPASKEFCLGLFKSLIMGRVDGSIPNPEKVLLDSFEQYLKGKVSPSRSC
jgi:hypothetical protein